MDTATAKPGHIAGSILSHDRTELFIRDWGQGRPILFLAGWALSSDMWGYQMEPLSRQGFRCIAFDRRGHGRSSDPGQGYDYDTLADDIDAVIKALDLHDLTIMAHSFGSGELVRYLTRHGSERVSGTVLLAPAAIPCLLKAGDNRLGLEPEAAKQLNEAQRADFPGWIYDNAGPYFGPQASQAIVDWTINDMFRTSLLAATTLNRVMTSTDFRPELRQLSVPTLILHGDSDVSAPIEITGRPAAELIPSARLEVYEGARHGLYYTHRQQVNRDLAQFAANPL